MIVRIESAGMAGWQIKTYESLQSVRAIKASKVYGTKEEAETAAKMK